MEMLQGVWKQHLRPRTVVGYGVKIFLPSPPNYFTRSPGYWSQMEGLIKRNKHVVILNLEGRRRRGKIYFDVIRIKTSGTSKETQGMLILALIQICS